MDARLAKHVAFGECWIWLSASTDRKGYPTWKFGQKGDPFRVARYVYEEEVGPIPADHHLDHECRDIRCVRPGPGHNVPVTPAENNRRMRASLGIALRHGTRACYVKGCRLPECRAAHVAYMREYDRQHPDRRKGRKRRR